MKILFIMLTLVLALNSFSQEKKVSTSHIINTLEEKGLDSAMVYLSYWHRIPIYVIDTSLTNKLVSRINKFSSIYSDFFLDVAYNYQTPFVIDKTFSLFKAMSDTIKKLALDSGYKKIYAMYDNYLYVLVDQNKDSLEHYIKKDYDFWANAINEVEKIPFIKMIFLSEKRSSLIRVCHYNCYIFMQALKCLDSHYYSESLERHHNSETFSFFKGRTLGEDIYRYAYNEYSEVIFKLSKKYDNLGDIVFKEEEKLMELIKSYSNEKKCWNYLIYNGKKGILDLGCNSPPASIAGNGERIKMELIENDKLKLIKLNGWNMRVSYRIVRYPYYFDIRNYR